MADSELRRLLGGRTPAAFLRGHWQKDPLLIRAAIPDFASVITRDKLFALAARDDVYSRLVQRVRRRYTVSEGPFRRATLARLPARNWTLLVQSVNGHDDDADALLRRFAFIPFARLDDLMVSYAAPGGGVGPHYDSYDVFLLQALGRRRWRYGRQVDLRTRQETSLAILERFTPQHDSILAPGDMLYLPPAHAHDGVAVDACITYSIGFRAASNQELAEAFLDHLRDAIELPGRYADPDLRPTHAPARIDLAARRRVARMIGHHLRWHDDDIARFLGRFLTEPGRNVVFTPGRPLSRERFRQRIARTGLRLDRRVQLLYDDTRLFINADDRAMPASGRDRMKRLANLRELAAADCRALSRETIDLLHEWHRHGFVIDRA